MLYRKVPRGRKHHTRFGQVARSKVSRQAAARERDPWLIVASPELEPSARQLIELYWRRMQIELSFRDLKSHRYGQAFEDSLSHKSHRIEILLLLKRTGYVCELDYRNDRRSDGYGRMARTTSCKTKNLFGSTCGTRGAGQTMASPISDTLFGVVTISSS